MIEFHVPTLADKPWVEKLFRASGRRASEYNFVSLFNWCEYYHQEVGQAGGFATERLIGQVGHTYLYPAGEGDLFSALEELRADAAERGERFRLICVPPEGLQVLDRLYPGRFQYTEDRFGFDYLYEIDRLADLGGKKLHGKRNHITRFVENWPDWTVQPLTEELLGDCLALDEAWYQEQNGAGERSLSPEGVALRRSVDNFAALELDGLLLRAGGRPIAFTIGSRQSEDTYEVHFEKAPGDIQGAYPMINREFARYVREKYPSVRYMNREDDMGLEGLRRAKESYYPDQMVEKYSAQWIN